MTATLYHEVSHQLLFESAGRRTTIERNVGNYWVFEGLGTYFETLTAEPDGSLRIGGLVGPRIDEARRPTDRERRVRPDRASSSGSARTGSTSARRHLPALRGGDGPRRLPDAGARRALPRGVPRLRQGRLPGPARSAMRGDRWKTGSGIPYDDASTPSSWRSRSGVERAGSRRRPAAESTGDRSRAPELADRPRRSAGRLTRRRRGSGP